MDSTVRAWLSAAPPPDEVALRRALTTANVPLPAGARPFVESGDLAGRYGFALPADLLELWRLADQHGFEQVDLGGFRYVRVAPGGWEPPATTETYRYFAATVQRFEWNTFSNLQLLERLAGLAPLGWDQGDDRLEVATCDPDAPVFWLDHETADLLQAGCVAHSLDAFLRIRAGSDSGHSAQELALARDGSNWARATDGHAYLPCRGPLHEWPPFLWARHAWVVAELSFGSAREQLARPEVHVHDFSVEQSLLSGSEPLALYWPLRSVILDDQPTLATAVQLTTTHVSPLVRAVSRFVRETPTLEPDGLFAAARARAASYRGTLLGPRGGGFDPATF